MHCMYVFLALIYRSQRDTNAGAHHAYTHNLTGVLALPRSGFHYVPIKRAIDYM